MKQVKFMGSFILCFLLISITFFTKLSFAQTDVPLSITSNFYLPNAIAGMVYETSINAHDKQSAMVVFKYRLLNNATNPVDFDSFVL